MARVAVLKLIFSAPHWYADTTKTVEVSSEDLGNLGPTQCWVTRTQCCGSPSVIYGLTFNDPLDSNAVVGYFLSLKGQGVVVDLDDPQDLIDFLNDCCSGTVVNPIGNSTYAGTIPAFAQAATSNYCITRADDGGPYAQNKAQMDYIDKVSSIVSKTITGTSTTYDVKAVNKPVPIGTDTIANGTCP